MHDPCYVPGHEYWIVFRSLRLRVCSLTEIKRYKSRIRKLKPTFLLDFFFTFADGLLWHSPCQPIILVMLKSKWSSIVMIESKMYENMIVDDDGSLLHGSCVTVFRKVSVYYSSKFIFFSWYIPPRSPVGGQHTCSLTDAIVFLSDWVLDTVAISRHRGQASNCRHYT